MWIILNPKKAHRFTTKGINLHKGAPTAFVKPDTEPEIMLAINRAIGDGRVLRIQGNEMTGMVIPKQAKIGSVDTEDTDTVVRTQSVRDENGKIVSTVIVMPDEDGNVKNAEPKQAGVILTGISETERDTDEDGEED
jgi:hypothetical protein